MASGNRVELIFAGDDQQLQKTFANVGEGAKEMATDVGAASKRMSDETGSSSRDIAGAVDASENKFTGLSDTIEGTGDVMEGFRTGNIAMMAMGFADIASGLSNLVIPALQAAKTAIVTGMAPALTMISAHPLIAGLIAGGAIIAGLIILEKKFGIVSGAARALGEAFGAVWDLIKRGWNATIGGFNFNVGIPSWVPVIGGKSFGFTIPSMHTGGVVPGPAGRSTLAELQAGETVLARGQGPGGGGGVTINVGGSVITERDLGRIVADALRQNKLIGVTV